LSIRHCSSFVFDGQIDLHEACERIEQCDPPEDIFGAVLETAAQAYGEDESIQFMLEELASDPELADVCFLQPLLFKINSILGITYLFS
jgi:hypothetical protein